VLGGMRGAVLRLARLNRRRSRIEAVERIDALFAIEREINGTPPHERSACATSAGRPLVLALETWLREQRRKLSARNEVAKAIQYSLIAGRAHPASRGWPPVHVQQRPPNGPLRAAIESAGITGPFAGSTRAAARRALYTLVETAKLNDVDPQAWLHDFLHGFRIITAKRIDELSAVELEARVPGKAAA